MVKTINENYNMICTLKCYGSVCSNGFKIMFWGFSNPNYELMDPFTTGYEKTMRAFLHQSVHQVANYRKTAELKEKDSLNDIRCSACED